MNIFQFTIFKNYNKKLFHGVFPKKYGKATFGQEPVLYDQEILSIIKATSGCDGDNIVMCEQIHGNKVSVISSQSSPKDIVYCKGADGVVTNKKGIALSVRHADCIPIFLYDPEKEVVGLVHAGYKGVGKKIVLNALQKMANIFGCQVEHILVALGPCAKACCYEVGNDWPHMHILGQSEWQNFRKKTEKGWLVDLPGFVKKTLIDFGIKEQSIEIAEICTIHDGNYHSWTRHKLYNEEKANGVSIIGMKE